MKAFKIVPLLILICSLTPSLWSQEPIQFRSQEIDRSLKVGYSVVVADVNHDKKPDIVVADAQRVIWFENPTWKLHTIIQGQTKPDNVSIAAHDIDGDGFIDFALAADWKPFNTKSGGTLQWLQRGKTLDEPWKVHQIADNIPTIHRIRFARLSGQPNHDLMVIPLMGRGSSAANNWSEQPVEILSYLIPKKPAHERWNPTVYDRSLHVIHNFDVADLTGNGNNRLLTASYEGVTLFDHESLTGAGNSIKSVRIGEGNQSQPDKNRGASEIRLGRLKDKEPVIATIEPWHGNQVVVYQSAGTDLSKPWKRYVIDNDLKWGHGLAWADFDGDGEDELVAGIRDTLNAQFPCGVRLYKRDKNQWTMKQVGPGSVAVEDLIVADLNGDGKPDIVAVGRATGNVVIYWNETGSRK